ncbi:DUF1462 family protein [Chloroflexota bacterium]
MIKQDMQIIILNESKITACDADCGADWSSVEAITLARQRVKERFGDKVRLEYADLSNPSHAKRASEFKQKIRDENLSLPLLLINGKTRVSGRFDIRMLLNTIDAEMEIAS